MLYGTMRSFGFLLLLVGCNPQQSNDYAVSGLVVGGDMVAAKRGDAVYVANADVDSISRVSTRTGQMSELDLPGGPVRLAAHDGLVYVNLRAAGAIAVLEDTDDGLQVREIVDVGAEPVGMALSGSGQTLYVSLAVDNRVLALNTASMNVVRSWDIDGSPRWLELNPDNQSLYVGAAFGGGLWRIDLDGGQPRKAQLPAITLPPKLFFGATGDMSERLEALVRITGEMAVNSTGDQIAVPVLLVNPDTDEDDPEQEGGYGGGMIPGDGPMTPAIMTLDLNNGGFDVDSMQIIGASSSVELSEHAFASYLSEVEYTDGGDSILATVEGSEVVVSVQTTSSLYQGVSLQTEGAFIRLHPMTATQVPGGPRSIVLDGGQAYIYAFLSREVRQVDLSAMTARRNEHADMLSNSGHFQDMLMEGDSMFIPEFAFFENFIPFDPGFSNPGAIQASGRTLSDEQELGRKLFFSAVDQRMSHTGTVSCASCHFEGRNDGLTWLLEKGPSQTPSLSGGIADTAPFTWRDDVASVADEAMRTSREQMGGDGVGFDDATSMEAYIDALSPIAPNKLVGQTEAIERGKDAFQRAGCDSCHSGPSLTNNVSYAILNPDELINTPGLRGIASTGPYFHDGSAATLRDVLVRSRDGSMGDTSKLSEKQMDDLEIYLRSL
ncbi:MAG: cytochrome c peroxidase [Myxococcota bacterium]